MSFGGDLLFAPLSSMLGIRAGMNVCVLHAPEGFMEALMPLPEGTALVESSTLGLDVQVLFATNKLAVIDHLTRLIQKMAAMGSVWVCFPSQSDAHAPSEEFVRLAAVELGLTDVKKLMLDPAWNALKLQRKAKPPRAELPEARA